MVDSISSNMASPLSGLVNAAATSPRPEPSVQVTQTEGGRNGGNATAQQGGSSPRTAADTFEEINNAMEAWATGMRFEIDEDTQQLVVSIVDSKTGDVVRQVPSEEVLHIAKMISQFQGTFVSVKA